MLIQTITPAYYITNVVPGTPLARNGAWQDTGTATSHKAMRPITQLLDTIFNILHNYTKYCDKEDQQYEADL